MTRVNITIQNGKVTWLSQSGEELPQDKWEAINIVIANIFDDIQGNEDKVDRIKTHPDYEELELPVKPKFKVGDIIQNEHNTYEIIGIHDATHNYLVEGGTISFAVQDSYRLVDAKLKFKVGDNIKTGNQIDTIGEIDYATRRYYCESGRTIYFANQDLWKLDTKPHYDISNFKPFDKVLCRGHNRQAWRPSLYGFYDTNGKYPMFVCATANYLQCIPFEGNEHLLGTTDMCDEMYINW